MYIDRWIYKKNSCTYYRILFGHKDWYLVIYSNRVELQGIVLSEISLAQNGKFWWFSLIDTLTISNNWAGGKVPHKKKPDMANSVDGYKIITPFHQCTACWLKIEYVHILVRKISQNAMNPFVIFMKNGIGH